MSPRPNGNLLLALLNSDDARSLYDHLEPVSCPRSMSLIEPDRSVSHVYFLDEGIASLVVQSPEGHSVEAGIVGREGFIVPAVALGAESIPQLCQMQVPGNGRRIRRSTFVELFTESASLRALMLRFVQAVMVQSSYTSLSNAVHQVDERLARWLLMVHDRSESDDLALTHEFLSVMLAVRRPTVTNALHVLEGNGFIQSARGYITIRNRAALEEYAADAYGQPEAEYQRLIGISL